MRAGLLNTPVTILRRVVATDAYSTGTPVWVDALTTRARVQYKEGGMSDKAGEPVYDASVVLTLRSYHAIKADDRVRFSGIVWQQVKPPVPDTVQQCQYLYLRPLNT